MFNSDLLRRQQRVYRTGHKRWVLLAPYVSAAFWTAMMATLALVIYLSPVRIPLP